MTFAEHMKAKARQLHKALVLPEGTEKRTVVAARRIVDEKLASAVTLLGAEDAILACAKEAGVSLEGITLIDPALSSKRKAYAAEYHELRKHKGMTEAEAFEGMANQLRYGAMMVRLGDADAMVAGAENTTGNVLLASFQIIKTKPGIKSALLFVMATDKKTRGRTLVHLQRLCDDPGSLPPNNWRRFAEESAESCKIYSVPIRWSRCSPIPRKDREGSVGDKVATAVKTAAGETTDILVDES